MQHPSGSRLLFLSHQILVHRSVVQEDPVLVKITQLRAFLDGSTTIQAYNISAIQLPWKSLMLPGYVSLSAVFWICLHLQYVAQTSLLSLSYFWKASFNK